MTDRMNYLAWGLAALTLFAAAPPDALAQEHRVRVLSSWDDPVKLAGDTETVYHYEVSHNYDTGVSTRRAFDASGILVETVEMTTPPGPTPEEIDEAKAIIAADDALGAAISRTSAEVDGGFLLYADQHPACVAPARCLQFDLIPPSKLESVRFVVVDLASQRIVERDLFPDL